MNPPSALASAMNRDRKPFTYTPGGLDLSEIKSERMAKRLMRNAMNEGVPVTPVHTVQSPPPSATPMAMPNYNCLPVQVFPTFNLPANPKSLLRTRSHPDQNENLSIYAEKHAYNESTDHSVLNKVIGNNKTLPSRHDEYNVNSYNNAPINYGSVAQTVPNLLRSGETDKMQVDVTQPSFEFDKPKIYENIRPVYFNAPPQVATNIQTDYNSNISSTLPTYMEENDQTENKKEEVSVVKKVSKSEDTSEKQNGDTEAAVTVKLPTIKSEAKTETKVEVVKKTLPDGSIQEVKTTTTKTTIDGKTEITTETETTTFPKDYDEEGEYEVEEVEVEESNEQKVNQVSEKAESNVAQQKQSENKEINGQDAKNDSEENVVKQNGQLITQEEKHESSTTKVVILQSETQESEEEIEEENENDEQDNEDVSVEQVIVLKQSKESSESAQVRENDEENKEDEEVEEKNKTQENSKSPESQEVAKNGAEEIESEKEEEIEEEEVEEVEEEEEISEKYEEVEKVETPQEKPTEEVEEEEVEEEYEEAEDAEAPEVTEVPKETEKKEITEEVAKEDEPSETKNIVEDKKEENLPQDNEEKKDSESEVKTIPIKVITETDNEIKTESQETQDQEKKVNTQSLPTSINIPLREPSVPLEKVEEVEIKPIGPAKEVITKTHTEIITKTTDKPVGTHSTQTEYNVVENIVTVNRTTKTLDHAYEEIPDNIPTIRTFVPPSLDRNLISPQPVYKPYQPVFTSEPQTERRHSLLLDRISVDRQMPSDIYQNTYQSNQSFEERQWSQEPQSEVLTVSNVKPSTIKTSKNQPWYQRNENDMSYPAAAPSSDSYGNQWQNQSQYKSQTQSQQVYQPKPPTQPPVQQVYQPQPRVQPSPQPAYQSAPQRTPQPLYQPKPQFQTSSQPTYQPPSQPIYQSETQSNSQTIYQSQPPVQSIYQQEPQYQPSYLENSSQSTYKFSSNNYQTSQPSYTPKPMWTGKSFDSQSLTNSEANQYSYQNTESSETIQKSTQLSSSYVPPPWEQDSNYVANNSSQNYYQTTPLKTTTTPNKGWTPSPASKPASKFSKHTPTAYVPPAPNQSFVKPVNTTDAPKQQGRKTYYSEYERRYISVPETTYIPHETKFQPQPDPSPQYYYDNNEPVEEVEPQWRRELREFKEQSSKTTVQTEQTTVRPPWEEDPKYAAPKDFTPTPTWTQTLKPRSCRERSYEPEYIGSQEWPKTNTLGRGRPQSSYIKSNIDRVPDRTRGVSVDRYNPNNYQSPLTREHPPPASHILDPIVQGKTYHNPNVPAYHSRASAEPGEPPVTYQQPRQRESRATPVQSRSFKYLQWITGTED
ncbi:putative mediator of RNA polymerase II transcription subunit 26 isoform X1 [Colias croceus]|uniref:putative mediator of RNA polymerase II transcription subunit 26 isoform X1 n=1 Tax=Colias crocea TaxID=72248 RepID=UPI001E2810D0|nr:putative mediator of RNA polymerase II transcription subunit 26 isoform X1 [Colias croceus]